MLEVILMIATLEGGVRVEHKEPVEHPSKCAMYMNNMFDQAVQYKQWIEVSCTVKGPEGKIVSFISYAPGKGS